MPLLPGHPDRRQAKNYTYTTAGNTQGATLMEQCDVRDLHFSVLKQLRAISAPTCLAPAAR